MKTMNAVPLGNTTGSFLQSNFDPTSGLPQVFYADNPESYQMLVDLLKEYIRSDCWALTVNGEIIFSDYPNNNQTIKDRINGYIIRESIVADPHCSLLVHLHRAATHAKIMIYMFGDKSFVVEIFYNCEQQTYQMHYVEKANLEPTPLFHLMDLPDIDPYLRPPSA